MSLPLKADSDALMSSSASWRLISTARFLNRFVEAYRHAPQFREVLPLLEAVMGCCDTNLFRFIHHAITQVCAYLGIDSQIVVSSSNPLSTISCGARTRSFALCEQVGAETYLNPIGGTQAVCGRCIPSAGHRLEVPARRPFGVPAVGQRPSPGSPSWT